MKIAVSSSAASCLFVSASVSRPNNVAGPTTVLQIFPLLTYLGMKLCCVVMQLQIRWISCKVQSPTGFQLRSLSVCAVKDVHVELLMCSLLHLPSNLALRSSLFAPKTQYKRVRTFSNIKHWNNFRSIEEQSQESRCTHSPPPKVLEQQGRFIVFAVLCDTLVEAPGC